MNFPRDLPSGTLRSVQDHFLTKHKKMKEIWELDSGDIEMPGCLRSELMTIHSAGLKKVIRVNSQVTRKHMTVTKTKTTKIPKSFFNMFILETLSGVRRRKTTSSLVLDLYQK